ncbi:gp436 family protein [Brevundimonas sp.]|uniref:gp436 family protein n=1 Tax=Brevundimonas sp. TaxID=1871086 RepID=UPI003D6D67FE
MYATINDLIALCGLEELVQLTDRADPPTGEMDQAVLTKALEDGAAEIDGYVGAQYKLPLASAPKILNGLNCDIARYRLYTAQVTDSVRRRYEDAIKTLTNISRGVITLPVEGDAGGATEPAGRDDVMVIESEDRIFSRTSMRGL